MGDFVFNTALSRVRDVYRRVLDNDPSTSGFYIVAINSGVIDDTLRDFDHLEALLAHVSISEATNVGYARKELTDADLSPISEDDVNNRLDLDIPDQTWTSVQAGTEWTDLLVCYVPDIGTPSADSAIIPITCHDFSVIPDGTDITATVNANGFFRASG